MTLTDLLTRLLFAAFVGGLIGTLLVMEGIV